nr:MAG TPA: hypothetical protein [Caudoviricetes sp.]
MYISICRVDTLKITKRFNTFIKVSRRLYNQRKLLRR